MAFHLLAEGGMAGGVEMARAQAGLPLANQPSTMYHPPRGASDARIMESENTIS